MASISDVIGRLDEQGRAPLYQQLRRALRDAIADNRLAAEEALPPERILAEQLGVSRITVRKALDALVSEGMLTRRQGAGTFVAARVEKSFSKLTSFSEDMISRGRKPESAWLSRAAGSANPEESLALGIGPGSPVYRFNRIRFADGEPMALEYSTVPGPCLPSEFAVTESLYDALDIHSSRPVRALQRLRAVLFTGEKAKLLGVAEGAPGLFIERRGFVREGRPVEFTQSYYRGDAYDFVAELNTQGA
ncbi:GntR family transcriptional regulator [Phenylobacterium montanum]|uniref:GntR family transcriptional regulator n=1 Tax=Phenylobacterium montanum TaxID=2823693 RepID=A0A975G109_9CAUL|nr:GntR family transcriptional regulator [Caulobacter sp. S6]QUD88568.1 GntR family transcriptional regulator [Caulobacter sp. S6]